MNMFSTPLIKFFPTVRAVISRDQSQIMVLNIAFTALLFVALFLMGLEIDIRVIKKVMLKPIGPAIGEEIMFFFLFGSKLFYVKDDEN